MAYETLLRPKPNTSPSGPTSRFPGTRPPFFLVLGNQEREEGWKIGDLDATRSYSYPVLGADARIRTFLDPTPDTFYSGNTDPLSTIASCQPPASP